MKKMDASKRTALFSFGGALLIGIVGLTFVTVDVGIGYWIMSFLVAMHLGVIHSYMFKLDMSPPFGPIIVYSEENGRQRLRVLLLLFSCGLPLMIYLWVKTAFELG